MKIVSEPAGSENGFIKFAIGHVLKHILFNDLRTRTCIEVVENGANTFAAQRLLSGIRNMAVCHIIEDGSYVQRDLLQGLKWCFRQKARKKSLRV